MYNQPQEEGRPPDAPRFKHWSHPPNPYDDNLNNNHHHPTNINLFLRPQQSRSKPTTTSTNNNRNSFHHSNVDEALSSLLWQPYEYQHTSTSSTSTTSSSSLSDLGAPPPPPNKEELVNNPSSGALGSPLVSRASASHRSNASAISLCEYLDAYANNNNINHTNHQSSDAHTTDDMHASPPSVLSIDHNGLIRHSLQAANVVGLPFVHLRSASVPKPPPPPQASHQRINSDSARAPNSLNVSNVNVNFYRAVPAHAKVPTIECLTNEGNNVSNVQIMPLGAPPSASGTAATTKVTVHTEAQRPQRTFTSTEAQTDEIRVSATPPPVAVTEREVRRRERRERRHQKRVNTHRHATTTTADSGTQAGLPDLLNSHMPPPYSPLGGRVAPPPPQVMVPNQVCVGSGVVPGGLVAAFPATAVVAPPPPAGFRFPFPASGFRRGRFSEEPPKGCCGLLTWKPGSLRWFIAVIALVAVCCVLVGTALGAMRPAGRDHLTVSLLMIGVGIVLVTVSGVAWRLTSHDSSNCRSMLGIGSTESVDVCARRFVPRLPPSYGRPHHPYAAMMYPEFQYRPPPPSYQASMQEYRLRLLLLDRGNTPQIQSVQNAVSPPPTYRSHAGSLLRAPLSSRREAAQSEYSCPPSYRSQTSTAVRRTAPLRPNSVLHSREHSLSVSESNSGDAVVNVVNILASTDESDMALDNITLDSLKLEPGDGGGDLNQLKVLLRSSHSDLEGSKDGNLVTIVQTSDQSPVIVTVSGSSQIEGSTVQITELPNEMEILAHL